MITDGSLIIIDEPEISLHPEWQERFISLMASTFSGYRGCHFLLATHSPLIVAQASEMNCAVVTMDDLGITDASEYSNRSADFQLAEVFDTPGYRNEYLAREGLAALKLASMQQFESQEFRYRLELLTRVRPRLMDDDPVAQIADAVILSVEAARQ